MDGLKFQYQMLEINRPLRYHALLEAMGLARVASFAGGRPLNDLIDVALDQMAKGQLDAWQFLDSLGFFHLRKAG